MSTIDIGAAILFTLLVVACGMSFSSSGKNMKTFFSAGGALPWWMSGLSLFMSFFSAGTFVVWGSIAYSSGWVAITIQWTMCIAGLIIGFIIAPRWQRTHVITTAQYIKERLGLRVQKTFTTLFLLISTFSTGAFLYPVAKIVEVSTGIPIVATTLGLGFIILLYTAVGGLWAVIVTDILQFVVLTAAVLIVVPLALDKIGGISNLVSHAPDDFFSLVNAEYTWVFIFGFGLYNLFLIAGNWAYIQRFTSVASPQDARKVGLLFGALYLICPVIWMLAPMAYRILYPDIASVDKEGAYLLMCKEVLPVGMLGLILGGMVFATSSSINTALNITAGVLSNDVYRHFKPQSSQGALVNVGRIATILLGLITISVALLVPYMGGIVSVVMTLAALTGGALFLPPIWLLFSKYQNGLTILTTTFTTLAINAAFKFLGPWLFDFSLSRAHEMLLGVLLPVAILTTFEMYLRSKNRISQHYIDYEHTQTLKQKNAQDITSQIRTPPGNEENNKGVRVIAIGISAIGAIMLSLCFIHIFIPQEHQQLQYN